MMQTAILMLCDALALLLAAVSAWFIKWLAEPSGLAVGQYASALPVLCLAGVLMNASKGLYPGVGLGAAEELRRMTASTCMVFFLVAAATFSFKTSETWSRQIILSAWMLSLVTVPVLRALARRSLCRQSWWGLPCVIIGAGATGQAVASLLTRRPWLGLRAALMADDDQAKNATQVHGVPVIAPISAASQTAMSRRIRYAIIAIPSISGEAQRALVDALTLQFRHIVIAPALPGCSDIIGEARDFSGTMAIEIKQNLLDPRARVFKRATDVLAVVIGSVLILPLIALLALLIRVTSPGPVLYAQARIGRGGASFRAWKFRSMVSDADARLGPLLEADPALRREWETTRKLKNDPRVTWIGRILRRTSLDELPQLWNVLRGEMSLVGPRPIVSDEIAQYGKHFALFTQVRPGMSGLWQVSGRNDTTYGERVALDCYYVRNWSLWLDLVIIARTVRVVFLGKGAY